MRMSFSFDGTSFAEPVLIVSLNTVVFQMSDGSAVDDMLHDLARNGSA